MSAESTFAYFAATRTYLDQHGKPVAFYSDQASVFRNNARAPRTTTGLTQFTRALSELNIALICANTPQAKGRVERTHLTLQDRLVKELRLRDISTPAAANAYAPTFLATYNARFAKAPRSAHDAHRPVRPDEDLARIFTWQEERTLSKDLTLHFHGDVYVIEPSPATTVLRGRRCRIYATADGAIVIRHREQVLPFRVFETRRRVTRAAIVSNKRLAAVLTQIQSEQRARDQDRLRSPTVSLREKRQIRAARARADAPLPNAKVWANPTSLLRPAHDMSTLR